MSVTYTPLLNHVLLALEPEPEQSSVIQVQRATVGLTRFATVTAIGPEVREVKVGQRVLASLTAGVEIGEGVVMVPESSVLGVAHA